MLSELELAAASQRHFRQDQYILGCCMDIAGIGRVVFWEGGSLWLALVTGVVQRHSHHALQLCVPLEGEAQFQTEPDGEWVTCVGALIPPDVPHAFRAPGKVVANILFEPESAVGRTLLARCAQLGLNHLDAGFVAPLAAPMAAAYFRGADDDELRVLAQGTVAAAAGVALRPSAVDPRIIAAIAEIRQRIDEPIVLASLARRAGLSAGRFRHLFVAETGVSLRAFVLWERLNKALSIGFAGGSWTEAAHAANFADSAHLTRTCRRMFGLAPTSARVEELDHRQIA
ncbi:helix-turn-helix domain-containing protein [Devosia sp. CN2-171]|uniref:AraC family transcriptional regulator n=1 Tax=Devosia sp. CN2-171 TaxID=3400909 RepID=UPI003BF89B03